MEPREKPGFTERASHIFLSAGPVRAAFEAFVLTATLSLSLLISAAGQLNATLLQVLVIGPLAAILYCARAKLGQGRWTKTLPLEVVSGVVTMGLVSVPGVALVSGSSGAGSASLIATVQFAWNFGAFAFFRVLAYLWPRWVALRKSRLRWQMTHTTLTVIAAVAAGMVLILVALYSLGGSQSPRDSLLIALPTLGVSIFLTVIALGVVLPPAAVISYFAARRTARRLESFTHGTSGLREGNFAIRVEVEGEDEISDLQRDFNAMARDLERSVRDLRSERDNVQRLLKTQRELVASVSHELRTPVATIRGYLESSLDGRNDLSKDLRGDLEIMDREVVRLQRLIDDLFVLSRTETGSLPLEIRKTSVPSLLSRCAEAVTESAWRTGRVEVITDVDPAIQPALADEGRLEQAVRNLLQNAIRHTPPGGLVALTAASDEETLNIEVRDTGEGISPEDLDHVFERFYRSGESRRRDNSGAGLGLALVKELTGAMGGSVSVESEPGSGSRFILSLPRA